MAGAAHPSKDDAGDRRWSRRGRKPLFESKGKRPLESDFQHEYEPRERGLPILRIYMRTSLDGGVGKVTTGITGLWSPSVQSDATFWSFDVGSSYRTEAEFGERWIVHPSKGTWAGFRPSWDRLVLPYFQMEYGVLESSSGQYERNPRSGRSAESLVDRPRFDPAPGGIRLNASKPEARLRWERRLIALRHFVWRFRRPDRCIKHFETDRPRHTLFHSLGIDRQCH